MIRTLIGFGASSMHGAKDSQGGFFARLTKTLAIRSPDTRCVNLGVGGNTTREMLARADAALACTPRDMIVMLGCNDLPRDGDEHPAARTPLEEYAANLKTLLPKIKGERSLFISSFPVDAVRTGVRADVFAEYMAAAIDEAEQTGYQIWDLYAGFRAAPPTPFWHPDGLHFNDDGHAMLAEGVLGWYLGDE